MTLKEGCLRDALTSFLVFWAPIFIWWIPSLSVSNNFHPMGLFRSFSPWKFTENWQGPNAIFPCFSSKYLKRHTVKPKNFSSRSFSFPPQGKGSSSGTFLMPVDTSIWDGKHNIKRLWSVDVATTNPKILWKKIANTTSLWSCHTAPSLDPLDKLNHHELLKRKVLWSHDPSSISFIWISRAKIHSYYNDPVQRRVINSERHPLKLVVRTLTRSQNHCIWWFWGILSAFLHTMQWLKTFEPPKKGSLLKDLKWSQICGFLLGNSVLKSKPSVSMPMSRVFFPGGGHSSQRARVFFRRLLRAPMSSG